MAEGESRTRRKCVYALMVALVATGIYANSVGNGFIWDDNREIVGNRFDTHRLGRLPDVFTRSGMRGIYRPIKIAYLVLMYSFYNAQPVPYHVMCILLHSTVTVLVFLVGSRMVSEQAALLGALIFAIHPVHTEVVAWASGFLYSLSAFFLLGALLVHQIRTGRDASSWGSPATIRGKGGILAIVEGLLLMFSVMSVECGAAFIFIIPVYHWFASGDRRDLREWVIACAPAFVALAVYGFIRLAVVGVGGRGMTLAGGISGCLKVDVLATATYARILTIGDGLCVDRGWPIDTPLLSVRWLAAAAVCICVLVLGFILLRKTRAGAFLYWSAILSFIPVSNIIPTSMTPIADRYSYIPSIFLCILLGLAVDSGVRSMAGRYGWHRVKIVAAVLLTLLFGKWIVATTIRSELWGDPAALWGDTVEKNPASVIGNYNLGLAYDNAGRLEEAAALYRRTIELKLDHSQAHNNLGLLEVRAGRPGAALEHFTAAAAADPANVAALFNVAVRLSEQGEDGRALDHIEAAARLEPENPLISKKLLEIRRRVNSGISINATKTRRH